MAEIDWDSDEAKAALEAAVDQQTKGLKDNRDELLNEVKNLRKFKSSLGDDFDADRYQDLKKKAAQAEEDHLKKSGEWDKLKQSLIDSHAEELQAERSEKERALKSVDQYLKSDTLRMALAEADATTEGLKLLPEMLKSSLRVVFDDQAEAHRLQVFNGEAPRTKEGKDFTVADLVAEAADEFPSLFKGTGASGGGTQRTVGDGTDDANRTATEKIAAGMKKRGVK